MTTTTLDAQRQSAVEDELVSVLNHGALAVMLSIGHRTGLLDALARSGAIGSVELANTTGLNERYVREWLGALTTGRILDHDPIAGTYLLSPEHASLLTRSGDANLAVFAQYVTMMGTVEDDLVRCFQEGGGVPYDRFPRFHEVMAEDSGQTVLAALDTDILPLIDGLTDRLTAGIDVLDVGCGRGWALNRLAAAYPASRLTGVDLSAEAVEFANTEARSRGLGNVSFEVLDAATLAESKSPASYDLVTTFDAIHDQARPADVLRGIRSVLRDDGVYLAQDINGSGSHHGDLGHPIGPLLYGLSVAHCMTVSLAQGGEGLGTMWGRERAERYIRDAGFADVRIDTLPHDLQNAYYVCSGRVAHP